LQALSRVTIGQQGYPDKSDDRHRQENPSLPDRDSLIEISPGVFAWNVNPDTRHALVTSAIGGRYLEDFRQFSLPTWQKYAQRCGAGVVVFSDGSVSEDTLGGFNGAWLKMLLPELVNQQFPQIKRLALVDTDIIINPAAPDVFEATPQGHVGVVPEFSPKPGMDNLSRKRMAFLRKKYYDASYPLDSILFASAEQVYLEEGFQPLSESFCSGLLVLDSASSSTFSAWLDEAKTTELGPAVAWEQTYLNYKVLTQLPHHWLDQRFQVIWNLEMASSYPSLYRMGDLSNSEFAENYVADTLNRVYFLHFAGSWPESTAWKNSPQKIMSKMGSLYEPEFLEYLASPSTGVARGKLSFQPD